MPRILLIEDNEMNRDMLTRRLVRNGFDVETAVDGEDGLAKTIALSPDLILMDITLPLLDGIELTRRIRAIESFGTLPIIALTANATVEDREKALLAGCDEFETKPIDLQRLLRKIGAFLNTAPIN